MPELQFQSEGPVSPAFLNTFYRTPVSMIPNLTATIPSAIGEFYLIYLSRTAHRLSLSVENFNQNTPIEHIPAVGSTLFADSQQPSHTYLHNNPQAPAFPANHRVGHFAQNTSIQQNAEGATATFLDRQYSHPYSGTVPCNTTYLPTIYNPQAPPFPPNHHQSTYAETQAYFPQKPGSYHASDAFDSSAWPAEQGAVSGSSTSTVGRQNTTLPNITTHRYYHPYAGRKRLVRTGIDSASYSPSSESSRRLIKPVDEEELPLLWRAFTPTNLGDHIPSEASDAQGSEDTHSDARTLTVPPRGYHPVSLTDLQTERVVAAFGIPAICYERNVDTDTHTCPLAGFHKAPPGGRLYYCRVQSHPKARCTGKEVHNTAWAQHFLVMHSLKGVLCPFCLSEERHKQDVVKHFDTCEVLSGGGAEA
ncbi:hypothetical protein F5146DRAFT_1128098 [Armillaria mellea]|nr:hypothetical protein F5146DRAFT_1128098 [Armillaria mellea]